MLTNTGIQGEEIFIKLLESLLSNLFFMFFIVIIAPIFDIVIGLRTMPMRLHYKTAWWLQSRGHIERMASGQRYLGWFIYQNPEARNSNQGAVKKTPIVWLTQIIAYTFLSPRHRFNALLQKFLQEHYLLKETEGGRIPITRF